MIKLSYDLKLDDDRNKVLAEWINYEEMDSTCTLEIEFLIARLYDLILKYDKARNPQTITDDISVILKDLHKSKTKKRHERNEKNGK